MSNSENTRRDEAEIILDSTLGHVQNSIDHIDRASGMIDEFLKANPIQEETQAEKKTLEEEKKPAPRSFWAKLFGKN